MSVLCTQVCIECLVLCTQVCIECQERYCRTCFASYHKKGALARHRAKLVDKPTTDVGETRIESSACPNPGGLLDGQFSEEESAASFQEALLAWRRGGKESSSDSQVDKLEGVLQRRGGSGLKIHACMSYHS